MWQHNKFVTFFILNPRSGKMHTYSGKDPPSWRRTRAGTPAVGQRGWLGGVKRLQRYRLQPNNAPHEDPLHQRWGLKGWPIQANNQFV